jgi:hypothetical protein
MEKGNRKSKDQKSKIDLIPQPKSKRKATITISPDSSVKVDVQTGSVSDLEMYMFLRDITKHFATVLCNDAEEVVGDNQEDQAKYLDWIIKKSGLNG